MKLVQCGADQNAPVTSMQPVGRDGITVTIGWSDPDGLVCVNSVEATAAESVAMQRTVSLNCTYNGTSVIFCVTFTSPVGCPSSVANEILTPAGKRISRARRFKFIHVFSPNSDVSITLTR